MKRINVTLCSNEKIIFLKVNMVSRVKSIPVKNSFNLKILQNGPAQTLQSGNDSGDNTTWQILFNLFLINHIAQQRPLSPWRKYHTLLTTVPYSQLWKPTFGTTYNPVFYTSLFYRKAPSCYGKPTWQIDQFMKELQCMWGMNLQMQSPVSRIKYLNPHPHPSFAFPGLFPLNSQLYNPILTCAC